MRNPGSSLWTGLASAAEGTGASASAVGAVGRATFVASVQSLGLQHAVIEASLKLTLDQAKKGACQAKKGVW